MVAFVNGHRMAIRNFRNDSERGRGARLLSSRESEGRASLLSFLRPFVLSGKRAPRIDYMSPTGDWTVR